MSEPGTDKQQPTDDTPLLKILTPDATAEEIAAIVAVFAAVGGSGSGDPAPAPAPSAWSHPSRQVRASHRHGTGGWRASGLPR